MNDAAIGSFVDAELIVPTIDHVGHAISTMIIRDMIGPDLVNGFFETLSNLTAFCEN